MINLSTGTTTLSKPKTAWLVLALLVSLFLFAYSKTCQAQDTAVIYDSTGNAVAFIPSGNDTIYLWSGEPVAYIGADGGVYTYSGKFLGWYVNGILYDSQGFMIGFMDKYAPATVKIKTANFLERQLTAPPTRVTVKTTTTKPMFVTDISPTPFGQVYVVETTAQPVQ